MTLPARQQESSDLPSAWVDKLFERFAALYGRHWLDMWVDVPMSDIKDAWRSTLSGVSGEAIAAGIRYCATHNKFPPTAPEFAILCRDFRPRNYLPSLPAPMETGDIPPEIMAISKDVGSEAAKDPKAWARKIVDEHEVGLYRYLYGIHCAKIALGIIRE